MHKVALQPSGICRMHDVGRFPIASDLCGEGLGSTSSGSENFFVLFVFRSSKVET